MTLATQISGLFIGKVEQRWPGRQPSAIAKQLADGPQSLGALGFELDEQADLKVHGGIDKAVHHYAADHYETWCCEKPELSEKLHPGGFGENISTQGITEKDLCIGDILSLGTAKVQVSQGRQPCWKLNAHLEDSSMAARFQQTGWTGWYYRVVESGVVNMGDSISLLERMHPDWSLDIVIAARFAPCLPYETASALATLPELATNWRAAFAKKINPDYKENTDARLKGH